MNWEVFRQNQTRTSDSSAPTLSATTPSNQPKHSPPLPIFHQPIHPFTTSNPGNIVGGHKANLNNPNTSEESKQHSRDVLNNEFNGGDVESASDQGKNPNNV